MIRVLNIVRGMNRGGLETTLMNILRNIDRSKVQFDFLVNTQEKCDYDDEIRALGGKIYYIPPRREGIKKYKRELVRFFSNHKEYKIVHQHVSSLSDIEALKAAKQVGVPIRIVHSRNSQHSGSVIHKYLHFWNQRKISKVATDFFACSELAARWLFGDKLYRENNHIIINNGIETERFVFSKEKRNLIRRDLGVGNKVLIGNVGRLHKQKNHTFILDVFKTLNTSIPETMLILVGDGVLRNSLENKAKELGIQESVIFTGVRKDIPDLLQAMDIFFMPSLYEGLPGTVIEAQGAGLPCLISDSITKEVKITDLVVSASLDESIEKWKEHLINIINQKIERRNTSLELVEAGFDMEAITMQLQSFYIEKTNSLR